MGFPQIQTHDGRFNERSYTDNECQYTEITDRLTGETVEFGLWATDAKRAWKTKQLAKRGRGEQPKSQVK